jgi:hypothetical protein
LHHYLHRHGYHAENFLGDCEDLLSWPIGLEERDERFLRWALKHCVLADPEAPGGQSVWMSNKQFGHFVGARRRHLAARDELDRQSLSERINFRLNENIK